MKEIKKFCLNEHTNNLYKKEVISSISLAKEVADKINELVAAYNDLYKTKHEKWQEQDGKINKVVVYIKDNLLNAINELLDLRGIELIDNSVAKYLGALSNQLDNLIGKIQSGSITSMDAEVIDARVGNNGITYNTLGYAVREQFKEVNNRLRNLCIGTSNVGNVINFDTTNKIITLRGSIYFGEFTYKIISSEITLDYSTSSLSNSTCMLLLDRNGGLKLSAATSHPTDIVLAHVYFGVNLSITKLFSQISNQITIDGESYVKDKVVTNAHTCNIFKKVVCVGDSFTSGHIVDSSGVPHATNEDYAYPHFMEKLTGNTYVNCGKSGATALSWLTADRGLPKAKTSGKAQAYIIGLMINDSYNNTLPVGTKSDIGTSNSTYYGCLSRIVRELKTISPKAKIFICTCPNVDARMVAYNQAVHDIVDTYYESYDTHCLDLYKNIDMYRNDSLKNDLYQSHYSAVGYEQFAEILCSIMSNYINSHIEDFKDVAFIEYE